MAKIRQQMNWTQDNGQWEPLEYRDNKHSDFATAV
jgi:hypothetical protein